MTLHNIKAPQRIRDPTFINDFRVVGAASIFLKICMALITIVKNKQFANFDFLQNSSRLVFSCSKSDPAENLNIDKFF